MAWVYTGAFIAALAGWIWWLFTKPLPEPDHSASAFYPPADARFDADTFALSVFTWIAIGAVFLVGWACIAPPDWEMLIDDQTYDRLRCESFDLDREPAIRRATYGQIYVYPAAWNALYLEEREQLLRRAWFCSDQMQLFGIEVLDAKSGLRLAQYSGWFGGYNVVE